MTPVAKKWTGIAVAVLVLGGIAYMVFGRKKPNASILDAPPSDDKKPDAIVAPAIAVAPKPKASASNPKPVETGNLVKAQDVFASDINSANGKKLIANADGMRIYNMSGKHTASTKKNQILGTIVSASKVKNFDSYKIVFTSVGGTNYFTFPAGMLIQM